LNTTRHCSRLNEKLNGEHYNEIKPISPSQYLHACIAAPHGLPFSPLPFLVWSLTADFAITYVLDTFGGLLTVNSFADSTNISIGVSNNRASTATIYYRIFAFPPSGASLESIVSPVTTSSNDFSLNTDLNYLKLVNAGVISTSDRIYTHNLGYIPTVFTWLNSTHDQSVLAQWVIIDPLGTAGIKVTSTTIEFVGSSVNDTAVEYRIYADD